MATIAVAVVVALIALLALQLRAIESQRHYTIDQDRKVTRLLTSSESLLRALAPLAGSATHGLPAARRAARRVGSVLDEVSSLASQVTGSNAVPELVRFLDIAGPVLQQLGADRLIERAAHAVDAVPVLLKTQRLTLQVQLASLDVQRRTLRAQLRGLAVQEESLRHIRALDRRLGGGLSQSGGR